MATVLVDELVRSGVREAVLCPGSRSAPLAYALQESDRRGRLRLHVRIDERSAGFLALGLAKLTRLPALLVTTSGTAVANLHPAVLEAHHAQVPLVVMSADRPPELRGTGANQTTVQPGMFGPALRWSHELGAPARLPGQNAAWRSTVCRAVAAASGASGGEAGPVHLNVPLREPLVPTDDAPVWPEPLDGRPGGAPWVMLPTAPGQPAARGKQTRGGPQVGAQVPRRAAAGGPPWGGPISRPVPSRSGQAPDTDLRTLVVVGDLPEPDQLERVLAWARHRGWPVLAEPFGAHPRDGVVPHGSLLLTAAGWVDGNAPDRVITVGRLTLSRAVAALLRRPGLRVEAVTAGTEWTDPSHVVSRVHRLSDLETDFEPGPPRSATAPAPAPTGRWSDPAQDFAQVWEQAGAAVAKALAEEQLSWPTGLAVARTLWARLPRGATLFAGSSNAVRDLDVTASRASDELTIVASRGLAGIDGCVSTAVGLALTAGHPTYALLGDLTLLHDAGGLVIGPGEPRPDLTIVVVNDDGGGIFTLLEQGAPERAADFERIFGTPTGADLEALCRAHRVRHVGASSPEEFAAAVAEPPRGLTVVEVRVDRASHREAHARLREVAARAATTI